MPWRRKLATPGRRAPQACDCADDQPHHRQRHEQRRGGVALVEGTAERGTGKEVMNAIARERHARRDRRDLRSDVERRLPAPYDDDALAREALRRAVLAHVHRLSCERSRELRDARAQASGRRRRGRHQRCRRPARRRPSAPAPCPDRRHPRRARRTASKDSITPRTATGRSAATATHPTPTATSGRTTTSRTSTPRSASTTRRRVRASRASRSTP